MPLFNVPHLLIHGDCRKKLPLLTENSVDSVVTDPPYELGTMERNWDKSGVAFEPTTWKAILRVLKPGCYMLAMGGTRTYHRLTCSIEDAGFEIRDCLLWLYGSGFPKGQTSLKPGYEPIVLCRKPGNKVTNLKIDACRIPTNGEVITNHGRGNNESFPKRVGERTVTESGRNIPQNHITPNPRTSRWPSNVLHDGSDEILKMFSTSKVDIARFFYCAKPSKKERGENNIHPTVKPLALMRWMIKLVTPVNGKILDPFAGSGTTLLAAKLEGMNSIGIEQDQNSISIIENRMK